MLPACSFSIFDPILRRSNTVVGIKGDQQRFHRAQLHLYDGGAGGSAAIRARLLLRPSPQNTTVFGMATGVYEDNGTFTVTNTIATNSVVADFDIVTGTQSFNLSSDATAAGAGSLINRLASNQFLRTTAGAEDLHLKAGADALNAGTTLGGDPLPTGGSHPAGY
jgi:hypothetical protein